MKSLIVRQADTNDASRIAMLSEQLGYPVEVDLIRQRLEKLLPRPDQLILVAESSGQVVGWTHAAEQQILETGRHCEILGLVVAAGQRGQGTGRLLIEAIEQWASGEGFKQICVRSNVIRPDSHPFYERMGFTRVKTQHVYRREL